MKRKTIRWSMVLWVFPVAAGCGEPVADGSLRVNLRVEAVVPRLVPSRGGEEIAVVGDNFAPGIRMTVDGMEPKMMFRRDERLLSFLAPPLEIGDREIVLQNPDGEELRLAGGLRVYATRITLSEESRLLDEDVEEPLFGDVNGDGLDDLVTGGCAGQDPEASCGLRLFANKGEGQMLAFDSWIQRDAPGRRPLLLADLDGDGRTDLVDTEHVFFGRAEGGFADPVSIVRQEGRQVDAAWAADFDGDGRTELLCLDSRLVLHHDLFRFVEVGADGTMVTEHEQERYGVVRDAVWVDDLDADGVADLIYADAEGLVVELGPDLVTTHRRPFPEDWFDLDVRDVDGDATADVLVVSRRGAEDNCLWVCRGVGDGTFADPEEVDQACPGSFVTGIVRGEWRRSPDVPLVLARCNAWVLAALAPGEQGLEEIAAFSEPLSRLTPWPVNLDGDGVPDLVGRSDGVQGLNGWYANEVDATLEGYDGPFKFFPAWGARVVDTDLPDDRAVSHPVLMVPGDFGQGRTLAIAWDRWVTLLGQQEKLVEPAVQFALDVGLELEVEALASGDLDGDGDDDLVVLVGAHSYSVDEEVPSSILVLYNDGASLRPGETLPVLDNSSVHTAHLAVGSANRDETADILLILQDGFHWDATRLVVMTNTGNGFVRSITRLGDPERADVRFSDLDADGDLDLYEIGTTTFEPSTTIWWNRGDGQFVAEPYTFVLTSLAELGMTGGPRLLGLFPHQDGQGDMEVWATSFYSLGRYRRQVIHRAVATPAGELLSEHLAISPELNTTYDTLLGDVNGDGLTDATLVPQVGGTEDQALVTWQTGGGGLTDPMVSVDLLDTPGLDSWYSVILLGLVDVDGDGLQDIAYASPYARPWRIMFAWNRSH